MKIVLTIIGYDRVGIVAGVSSALAERKVNILDMNQNIMNGFFNMVMIADMSACDMSLTELQTVMAGVGEKLGMQIKIQHEDIFKAMHTV